MIDVHGWPIGVNLAIFAAAAAFVWIAGTRLAGYADEIGVRTGVGQAFLGMLLLGVSTSLPEVATTISGALIGNARLVTANLFGGVALQITVLAFVDLVAVRGALTYVTPHPVLLFQGVMLLLLLALALAGAALGEPFSIMGVGLTPMIVTAGYLLTLRASKGDKYLPRWTPTHVPRKRDGKPDSGKRAHPDRSTAALGAVCVLAALVILIAGWALALTGDALAEQTGLGSSFVGVAFLAASTSLPEVSTSLAAVRHGNHQMAVSNILGTNCLEVALFLLADVAYAGGPILAAADQSSLLAGALGMIVTCLLLLGLLERRDRTVAGMGVDSFAILAVYGLGLAGLYHLR